MPAPSLGTTEPTEVQAVVVFAEPTPAPAALSGLVDVSAPDPALWRLNAPGDVTAAGLFELWRATYCVTVQVGAMAAVRRLEALLAEQGRQVDLCHGWLDQAALVATAEQAWAVATADGALIAVVEALGRTARAAADHHRGAQFTTA